MLIRLQRPSRLALDVDHGVLHEKYLYLGLLALVVLNLTTAVISVASLRNFTQARDQARQSITTNIEFADVYSDLRDAESAQRGYLITGNQDYLTPYASGTSKAQQLMTRLRREFQHTTYNQEISQISTLTDQKIGEMNHTLALRKTQGFSAAVAVVNTNYGLDLMHNIQAKLASMENETNASTAQRDARANRYALAAYGGLAASFALTLGLIYFLRRIFRRLRFQSSQLEIANEELGRSNRELQDFASVASHDLQEPLRKIQAFGDRLATTSHLEPDTQVYLDRMLDAASRMRILIEDLLTYSRVTTKAKPFRRVSLKRIVQEVLSDMEIRIEETGAVVTVGRLPSIEADATQIRQLFQNLISNAVKFHKTDVKPSIKIHSKIDRSDIQDMVAITVEDNGIGFDQKYTDRIFTIFQRLHGRNEYEGTGIGLAVVRKIVERHGGTVVAESEIGKGSRFIVTLPIKQQQ